jgi:hypothetical protein
MSDEVNPAIVERLNQFMRESGLISEPPRYRYYEGANGNLYCWTVEKADVTDDDPKGWYASFIYRAYGKGSRSGSPQSWRPDQKTMRRHRKRKDAKARAFKMLRRDNPA